MWSGTKEGEEEMRITADDESYEVLCKVTDDAIENWYGTGEPFPQYLLDLIAWLKSAGPYSPILGADSDLEEKRKPYCAWCNMDPVKHKQLGCVHPWEQQK